MTATEPTPARADLHVHSKHSNRPAEWFLQKIAAPESYTEPLDLYRLCRERGMGFVTISDHDSVAGALEIAHLPGVFLSSEVTVSFPDDGCQIHCLVTGVTEEQHREIQRLRGNIYDFRDYLYDEDIVHSVAHPLYRVNDRLTLEHVEQLVVLFRRFEARNGIHDRHLNEMAEALLSSLTEEVVLDLAERHGLEPRDPEPWKKVFTGGSDDHGGHYIATTWTETPEAATVEEYLEHLRAGRHRHGGATGSSLRLAQSLFSISLRYFEERFAGGLLARSDPFAELLKSLGKPLGVRPFGSPLVRPTVAGAAPPKPALAESLGRGAITFLSGSWLRSWSAAREERRIRRAVAAAGTEAGTAAGRCPSEAADRATLARAQAVTARAVDRFARRVHRKLRRGRIAEAVGAVAELTPAACALAPFAVAASTQYKDEALLGELRRRFPEAGLPAPSPRKAWVTDTLDDVNGVSRTIRRVSELARGEGRALTTLACTPRPGAPSVAEEEGIVRFEPLSRFTLPGYEDLELAVPPFLELLDWCETERLGELVISTPGPMGLAALGVARLLGLRVTGIYHTDFPRYVQQLLGGPVLEEAAWGTMRWFFGQMDRIYVPSRAYGDQLVTRGFDPDRLALMPRGIDADQFRPEHRDDAFWGRHGLAGDAAGPVILYVGRISREKNLELLVRSFEELRRGGIAARLALVGDGPWRRDLERHLGGDPAVTFTGFLHGDELAAAYASADLFAFPSVTDTFGNAVLEALSSGTPAVVTDQGGPQEIVRRKGAGLVAEATPETFARALASLAAPTEAAAGHRRRLGGRGRETGLAYSWQSFLHRLWDEEADQTPWKRPQAPEPALRWELSPREERATTAA